MGGIKARSLSENQGHDRIVGLTFFGTCQDKKGENALVYPVNPVKKILKVIENNSLISCNDYYSSKSRTDLR
jgi:hypothetical protein